MLAARDETCFVFDRAIVPARFSGIEDRITTICGELGNFSHVLDAVKQARPRVIYHLGAMLSIPANDDPPAAFAANVQGVFHVLEAARLLEVEAVRFTSSVATYGLDLEGQSSIGDLTLQRPSTLYGTTKVFGSSWAGSTGRALASISGPCVFPRWWVRAPQSATSPSTTPGR